MTGKFPLLPRKKNTDKSHYGHTLVLAGSDPMPGAAALASHAALVSGSGLVTLGTTQSVIKKLSRLPFEIMRLELPKTVGGISPVSFAKILSFVKLRNISSVVIGPGLSRNDKTMMLVRRLVSVLSVPVVLDADGINSFKGYSKELRRHASSLVVTPHKREFKNLFGEDWPEDRAMRTRLAKKLSKFYDVVLVLKGDRSLVVHRDRVYENRTGNPGMAKGGTGDVLAGIIASFISQGLKPYDAACWAVYFHGKAGDRAVKEKSELGLVASDLIEVLPKVFLKK